MQSQTALSPHAARILVVDDNPPFRHLLATWLRAAAYAVVEAADGGQALNQLTAAAHTAETIDLILLDLQMEPMGGLNFMEQLQATPHTNMPVVLITADPSTDILLRASKMGFAGVMKKPVTQQHVLKMVAQQLERRQTATALTAER